MPRRLLVIRNPAAGARRDRLFDAVMAELGNLGVTVDVRPAGGIEHDRQVVAEAAISGRFDAVAAAGGDGTIRGLALGLVGTGFPLGVIPCGTGNVLAHEFGLSTRQPRAIAATLAAGELVEVRTGLANGVPFLLMAGIGFDGRVVAALDERVKRRLARLAYVGPGLRAVAGLPVPFEAVIDGAAVEATWLIAAKARRYGGSFLLSRRWRLDQPGLHAVVVRSRSRAELACQLSLLAARRLERAPGVTVQPCTRLAVTSPDAAAPVQVDGEAFGTTPVEIEAGGPPVRLIAPAGWIEHG